MKFVALFSFAFCFCFQTLAAADPHCTDGQQLICIPNQCSNGSIGCRDNPPTPTCFCASPPVNEMLTQSPSPQDIGAQIECRVGPAADQLTDVRIDLPAKSAVFYERYYELGIPKTISSNCQQTNLGFECQFVTTESEISEKPENFSVLLENNADATNPASTTAILSIDPWFGTGPSITMTCAPLQP